MSERIEKVNELLRSEIATIVNQEGVIRDGLITITHVKTGKDLKNATILISVLPLNQSGSALKELKKMSSHITAILRKRLNIKTIPRFNWKIDSVERHAVEIENLLNEIEE